MTSYLPLWIALTLLAPFVGSFLGVLIVRLPAKRDVVFGRSQCDHCDRLLGSRDLIPLISWLTSKGRCRYCGAKIDILHPLVEVAAVPIVLWTASVTGDAAILVASCALGWLLLAIAWIDWRDHIVPNPLTLPLFVAGFAATYLNEFPLLGAHLVGAVIGYGLLAGVTGLYRRLRGHDGLGMGDAKLLGALGIWIGWQGLPATLLIASTTGLVFALLRSGRLRAVERIAFGPFLALGGWIVWLYGPLISR